MITARVKKQTSITYEKLKKIALYYLGRYEASEQMLKDVLLRRINNAEKNGLETTNAKNAINNIITQMKEYGYVDDQRFASNKTKELFQKGKSKKNIINFLKTKGVSDNIINDIIRSLDDDNNHNTDINAGINYAKRKKLGLFRQKLTENTIKKELGKMARAGFSYEIAKKIILAKNEEELKDV